MSNRIYVDVDDVLAETTRSIVAVVEQLFGKRVPFEALATFRLDRAFGLDVQQYARLMHEIHRPEWLEELEPLPGSSEALASWTEQGFDIAVVTGRPPTTNAASRRWLERRGIPHASFDSVDKYARHGGDDRHSLTLDALRKMEFAVAVEDSLEMAALLAEGSAETVLLVDRPWNRDVSALRPDLAERIFRVADWDEIARRFRPPGGF